VSSLKTVRMLTRYAAWANGLLYQTISTLPEVELTKKQSIVFGSLFHTLSHVYAMDLVWQAHLQGRPHAFTSRVPELNHSFAELRSAQFALDQWYVRTAEDLSDGSAEEIVNFAFIGGGPGSMTRGDILLHVVNHTTYHRGHIADMLYRVPVHPPTTDLPVFLRECH
jgi:uncharacterized damage-inducible protein DinB